MIDNKTVKLEVSYRHKRTGEIYTTHAISKMKSGKGNWESAIIYFRAEDSAWFVRDFTHFFENFEIVKTSV